MEFYAPLITSAATGKMNGASRLQAEQPVCIQNDPRVGSPGRNTQNCPEGRTAHPQQPGGTRGMQGFIITARPPTQGQLALSVGAVEMHWSVAVGFHTTHTELQVQLHTWCCAVRWEQRNQTTEKWIKKREEQHLL